MISTVFTALKPDLVSRVILNDVGPEVDPAGLARIASYVGKVPPIVTWQDAARARSRQSTPRSIPGSATMTGYAWHGAATPSVPTAASCSTTISTSPRPSPRLKPRPTSGHSFRELRAVPTMVLRGATSDILAATTVEKMRAAVPELFAIEVPDRGHVPLLSEPVAIAAIDRFLNALPARIPDEERTNRQQAADEFRQAQSSNPLAKLTD